MTKNGKDSMHPRMRNHYGSISSSQFGCSLMLGRVSRVGKKKGRGQGHKEMTSVTRSEESSEQQQIHVIFSTVSLPGSWSHIIRVHTSTGVSGSKINKKRCKRGVDSLKGL